MFTNIALTSAMT